MRFRAPSLLYSALYVARSNLRVDDPIGEVRRFGEAAQGWNSRMGVGGTLIVRTRYFAHLFEGPTKAIDRILEVVPNDEFHSDVRVLRREMIAARRLGCWQIGYKGGASYIDRQIAALLVPSQSLVEESLAIQTLTTVLLQLGATCSLEDRTLLRSGIEHCGNPPNGGGGPFASGQT